MLRVIAIGRLRDAPEAALFARYAERMRPKLALTEIPEARGAPAEIKRREAAALLGALPDGAFAVALDQAGESTGQRAAGGIAEPMAGIRAASVFF